MRTAATMNRITDRMDKGILRSEKFRMTRLARAVSVTQNMKIMGYLTKAVGFPNSISHTVIASKTIEARSWFADPKSGQGVSLVPEKAMSDEKTIVTSVPIYRFEARPVFLF